ncbi:MAG: hypothetical protein JNK14_18320 [Chitinophagaceae bacterium]|nr:hypothetical protein [Chitinophagaceae bacterium]
MLFLFSCSSYNRQAITYYSNLQQGNYEKAAKALDDNRLLQKNRNRLLYLLERGKICHLLQQYDSSNQYFNEADHLIEDARTTVKDIALGNLLNPMMQAYKAEDFEKYLTHYYKALNYLQLGRPDEAMVEARRITLRSYAQEDKAGNKDRYAEDAFSFILQGMIYEKNGDINNAFIAYRNAADVYLQNNGSYYGIRLPEQLKKDLLRTAYQNGFVDEAGRYERLFNFTFQKEASPEGGELILFWENGSAPVKEQQDIFFTLFKDAGGSFFFRDAGGLYNVPFDFSSGYNRDNIKLNDLRSFRVALPKYRAQPLYYTGATITVNNNTLSPEPAESISTLAFSTLQERMLRELSSTLTRLAIKKLAEAAVRPAEKKETDSKKEKKKKDTQEAIALGLQLFNFASEKADTRNWQSLPHTIYYSRIPLKRGVNEISLQINGPSSKTVQFSVNGDGRLQFRNICTLR